MKKVQIKKFWRIANRTNKDVIGQILENRGIEDQEVFLNPSYDGLHDPFLMHGMSEAVARIEEAIRKKEKIGIFGDYDADGIPATALLCDVLAKHGLEVDSFIGKRAEGYGLNRRGIDEFAQKNIKLIITVDLGITGKNEVEYAKKLGIDVIITDHHEPNYDLMPGAIAVIDPKQKQCKYPFKELSGAAIAFKLACGLCQKTSIFSKDQLKWYLDLVAISTFCDMVPLIGENRILAKFGLIVLDKTKRVGLKELYKLAGVEGKITPYAVGFLIGPRLNAPGRMGDSDDSLRLLLTTDHQEARELAGRLDKSNMERQNLLKMTLAQAEEELQKKDLLENKFIMVGGEDWSEGIVGLVAGKLIEKYNRPIIVYGYKDGVARGSGRSIDDFSIIDILGLCQQHIIKYGGHKKAAGLTFDMKCQDDLYEEILKVVNNKITDDDLMPKIRCDVEIELDQIDWTLFLKLDKIEPFGMGNPRPVFVSRNTIVKKTTLMGKSGDHVKLELKGKEKSFNAVAFGFGGNVDLNPGKIIDIVYTIDKDDWRGDKKLQVKLIDFQLSI